ncbi:MAG: carboxypeptidase-like regulatory domain-containing protein [Polaromonas sp.]|uniref:carboxypeptidase-like regulatory domain-containing protein n=1 Tax=Polaromonas sp. TaxID=1869339 RepID=UPI00248A4684|nr:carboxypeptidase-like regulatory domain-containing protein [Polaromonas sp.]MDI1267666.1 carboxypeptidase-like regulatory domain-containing protein [Polaromonas sp.]
MRGCRSWLLLPVALVLVPGMALASVSISTASLERGDARTRIVLESRTELRFSLYILRHPGRVVLELEDVELTAALTGLAGQITADHPYMQAMQVRPSPSGTGAVLLEFGLKAEAEPNIFSLKPETGRGYRLVLDIAPSAAPTTPPAPAPAPAPAARPTMPPRQPPALAASTSPPAAPATTPGPLRRADELNLVLLEVQLDEQVLADAITTYQAGRETFLPLGELARLLTLAIRTQAGQGTADGYVLSEARGFNLDAPQGRITLADQTQLFDRTLVRVEGDDIYVAASLLSRWLPLDFEVDLSSLALRVKPRERLPLQERLERERRAGKLGARTGYEDPGYPRVDMPYRLLGVPFIDQTFGMGLRTGNGSRQTSANYTAYLTGDLLGLESAFFVSSTRQDPSPDVRFTLARHDPDAGLLGPLRARSVMFGSGVSSPSVTNIAGRSATGKGYGLTLSNRPITQPTSFDRHTLQGDLPPGWDVELYFNEALVGFQSSRADGRYSFDDQPLAYGANEFRLVFHGPLGQQRVERQSFLLEQSSTPTGAFYYNLAQHQDSAGQSRSVAQFEWGLNKYLTGTGGFVRLPSSLTTGSTTTAATGVSGSDGQLYSNLGLRGFWKSFILSSDLYRSSNRGWLNESGLKTRVGPVSLSYSHLRLKDFVSELFSRSADPLRTRDKLRLDGAIPAGWLPRLPVTVEVQREQFQSGLSNVALTGRVAAYVRGTSIANQLTWQNSGGATTASGALQLSYRVGVTGLSGQLGYLLKPQAKLDTVVLSGDRRLGEGYLLNLGLVRAISSRETLYTAGLNKSLGSYGLGLSTSYSSTGVLTVGVQLFIAMGREPRQGQWRFDALPKADSGAASARVFVDSNANGIMDAGEEAVENAAITVNGSRAPVRTDAAGIAWLDRLPTRQHVDLAVDTQTLEDPYWAPVRKGVRMVPRPGHVAEIDFPIILTSEIDGTVYLAEHNSKRGIGDVVIELLDSNRRVVTTIKTSSDGYYIVPAIPQGRYYVQVSLEQLGRFGLVDPGVREINILPDGKFINGVDFLLRKKPAGPVSGFPREEHHEKK